MLRTVFCVYIVSSLLQAKAGLNPRDQSPCKENVTGKLSQNKIVDEFLKVQVCALWAYRKWEKLSADQIAAIREAAEIIGFTKDNVHKISWKDSENFRIMKLLPFRNEVVKIVEEDKEDECIKELTENITNDKKLVSIMTFVCSTRALLGKIPSKEQKAAITEAANEIDFTDKEEDKLKVLAKGKHVTFHGPAYQRFMEKIYELQKKVETIMG